MTTQFGLTATITADELTPGTWVHRTHKADSWGPRGGLYVVKAYRVQRIVTAVEPAYSARNTPGYRVTFSNDAVTFLARGQQVDVRIPEEA